MRGRIMVRWRWRWGLRLEAEGLMELLRCKKVTVEAAPLVLAWWDRKIGICRLK